MIVLVHSNLDPAGRGMAKVLERLGFKTYGVDKDLPYVELTDLPKANGYVMLSRHSSSKAVKAYTVHHTGNVGEPKLGGEPNSFSLAWPSLSCLILRKLMKARREGYDVTYEATHHGPTIPKPLVFVEIGSTEREWNDEENHERVASAVAEALKDYDKFQCSKVALWVGGTHYAKRASKRCLEGICISHILAKYTFNELNEDVLIKAFKSSAEAVDLVIVEKKVPRRIKEMVAKLFDDVVLV